MFTYYYKTQDWVESAQRYSVIVG